MTPPGRVIHKCRMQFPRHCVAPRVHIAGIATFVDAVENSFNRIACETAASALAACVPRRARGSAIAGVGPLIRAWAAPWRISRGWRACRGVNAHCQRFACERHAKSGAVAPTTQTVSPTTPRCRHLLPKWFALWAAQPRGATSLPRTAASLTASGGSCAARGPVRDVPAGDIATKRGELHH